MNARALGRRLGSVAMIGILVSTFGAGSARAGGASPDEEKQARALYERAEKSFDVGKFAEALADYQAAYEAKPLPGFLFNIAQCYRNMGNYERARFFFRRYLSLDPHAPNHRRVDELIAEMTKQLDAQAAAAAAAASTTTPSSTTTPPPVEPKPGEAPPAVASPVAPSPVESAPGAGSVALVTATAPPPAAARRPVWKRWWFWTGVGAVVAGGVVAAFFLTRPETRTPGSLDPIDGR